MFEVDANFVAYVCVFPQRNPGIDVNYERHWKQCWFISFRCVHFALIHAYQFDEPDEHCYCYVASVFYRNQPLGEQKNRKSNDYYYRWISEELLMDFSSCQSWKHMAVWFGLIVGSNFRFVSFVNWTIFFFLFLFQTKLKQQFEKANWFERVIWQLIGIIFRLCSKLKVTHTHWVFTSSILRNVWSANAIHMCMCAYSHHKSQIKLDETKTVSVTQIERIVLWYVQKWDAQTNGSKIK